jgi:hypothetical protein
MPSEPLPVTPADPDDLRLTLSMALRQDGRKRFRHGDELMANLTADHIIRWLERCNYVVMRKPPRAPHSTSGGMDPP